MKFCKVIVRMVSTKFQKQRSYINPKKGGKENIERGTRNIELRSRDKACHVPS